MRVYVGISNQRVGPGDVRVTDGHHTQELKHHVKHSPDGFSWGYMGSGPAELARCLLWDVFDREPHPSLYHAFKASVVAHLPQDGYWTLTEQEVRKIVEVLQIPEEEQFVGPAQAGGQQG